MKRLITLIVLAFTTCMLMAQTPKDVKYVFTEASDLNLIGKIQENTPNPYHRVDTLRYKGFSTGENIQVRCPAGLAVLFKTNSTIISVKTEYGWEYSAVNTMPLSYRGYDLYIKDNGRWRWAAARATTTKNGKDNLVLIQNMDELYILGAVILLRALMSILIHFEMHGVQIGKGKHASDNNTDTEQNNAVSEQA